MRSSEDIEKIVRDGKPNVKTGNQLDKLIIDGSHSILDESKLLSPNLNMFIFFVRHKIAVSAIAVLIILVTGMFMLQPETEINIEPPEVTDVIQTPAEMMSLLSINLAYNRGGLDEVEKQYEKAVAKKGSQAKQITITELLAESNGT